MPACRSAPFLSEIRRAESDQGCRGRISCVITSFNVVRLNGLVMKKFAPAAIAAPTAVAEAPMRIKSRREILSIGFLPSALVAGIAGQPAVDFAGLALFYF